MLVLHNYLYVQLLFSDSLIVLHFQSRSLCSWDDAYSKNCDWKWKNPTSCFKVAPTWISVSDVSDELLKEKILPLDGAIVMLFKLHFAIVWTA